MMGPFCPFPIEKQCIPGVTKNEHSPPLLTLATIAPSTEITLDMAQPTKALLLFTTTFTLAVWTGLSTCLGIKRYPQSGHSKIDGSTSLPQSGHLVLNKYPQWGQSDLDSDTFPPQSGQILIPIDVLFPLIVILA